MNIPLEITFHGMAASPALRDAITERAAKLERLAPDMISCQVTIELLGRRHHQGNIYRVHARLLPPGGELDAGRSPPARTVHEDPYVAVRDTFNALQKRLEEHLQRQRGEVKHHDTGPRLGRILELYPDTGYGVIQSDDGHEVQFHRSSLARGNPGDIEVGREVRFVEVPSENGLWAGNVRPSGKEQARVATDAFS